MGTVMAKVAKFITVITLGIKAVVAKMTCPSTDKHLSSPDMILTVEGVSVAVSWHAALSLSTSLMTSARVWGSFSYILDMIVGVLLRPLTKMWIAAVSLSKAHHLAAVLK